MRIPPEKIEEIRSASDIVDVISQHVRLKKRGKNFIGLCPFHQEKTPSFTVSSEKQVYHCFGCAKGGNVITFVMEFEKISFTEAVRSLAEKAGINISFTEVDQERQNETEALYNVCRFAGLYFHNNLTKTDEGRTALEYFHQRGFSDETIRVFGLGYSLNSWDGFVHRAKEEGLVRDDLLKAGLIRVREDGTEYDYFRGRAMFPIISTTGRVVGFGARKLREDDPLGKYINSPETPIYNKSRVLFGLFHSKDAVRAEDNALMVEGYADLISLYQAGFQNVVASSGTALTEEQVQLISRYGKKLTLVYDADSAGSNATLRGMDIALAQDLDISIVELPEGEDPDSFIKKSGGKEFQKLLDQSTSFIDFKARQFLRTGSFSTPEGKAQAVRSIVQSIAKMKDELKRAVAFTNKSADELKERVKRLLRKGVKAPSVSTFHSFCVRVLRSEIEHLGYKRNFTIYDTADQLSALKEALREVRLVGRGDADAKRVLAAISRAKNEGREVDPGDGTDPYAILAAEAAPRYASALKAYNAVDFDDLLVFTLKLFNEFPEVLERWRERCRHVLVDEFQDTNAVQYRLVSLLAGVGGNLTVVGDDDQSIYGWRGALPGNILDFTRDWPTAKVITLDQNYRSTGHILAAANTIIRKNPARREKNLWSDLGEGVPVTVLACKDSEDEANAVVERIIGLVASDKAKPADCAVIFRTNAQSRPFEDVLRRHRLRYVVIGGMRFYDRKEVRDLIAYLQAIHNPLDEIALLRVVNYPARGVGNETIHRLQAASLAEKRPLAEVMANAADVSGIGERQARALGDFLGFLGQMRERFRAGHIAEPTEELVRIIGLEDAARHSVKDPVTAERKAENVREVVAALANFEQAEPEAGLGDYLAGVNLSGRDEESDEFSGDCVTLLTMHGAKGLEYPHVFLTGLEEGLLPHRRSEFEVGGLEEERRLAYVGMTRARRSLTITYAAVRTKYAKQEKASPSRFLEELPGDGVRREDRRDPREDYDDADGHMTPQDFFGRMKRL